MAFSFRKFLAGINIKPKTTSTADSQGDMDVTSSAGKLNYHNGITASPMVTEAHASTLTNKTIDVDANTVSNVSNATIKTGAAIARNKLASGSINRVVVNDGSGVQIDAAAITANRALISDANGIPTQSTVTATELASLSGLSGNVTTDTNTQTLSNKTLDNTNVITIKDTNLTIQDDGDVTKQVKFEASGITTATTRTLTIPDANTTIVGTDVTQTLTNKTISGSSNTITNVSLTTGVTGILPIANGGTNANTKAAAFDSLSPMTTSGDIIYGGASGTGTRLPKGSDGQLLALASGIPAWVPAPATSPLTTKGDVYTYSTTNDRLPVGTNSQILTADSTASTGLKWGSPLVVTLTAPTVQKFTSGSGTYTTPAGVTHIRVRLVGGGGGGSGSGTGSFGTAATAGGNSTFGTSLIQGGGGSPGVAGASAVGGVGGNATLGSGPIGTALTGGQGGGGTTTTIGTVNIIGGSGGTTAFGGAGVGAGGNVPTAGTTNTGAGGAGGGAGVANSFSGQGGGAGGFVDAIIASPSASYSYVVGAAGGAGGAGSSGTNGAAGGSGYIEITEYYQIVGNAFSAPIAPTIQKFTSGSGTYTLPTVPKSPLYIRVRMVGGGGGGAGSGTPGTAGNGNNGTNSTFGTSLLQCNFGSGALKDNVPGGAGGTSALGSGPIGSAIAGGSGQGSFFIGATATSVSPGAAGGANPFGGAGQGSYSAAGTTANINTGGGGGGGSTQSSISMYAGAGGGAGGFVDAIIISPSSTYAYSIGLGGSGGSAGSSGFIGGNGAAGYIEVTEYYQ